MAKGAWVPAAGRNFGFQARCKHCFNEAEQSRLRHFGAHPKCTTDLLLSERRAKFGMCFNDVIRGCNGGGPTIALGGPVVKAQSALGSMSYVTRRTSFRPATELDFFRKIKIKSAGTEGGSTYHAGSTSRVKVYFPGRGCRKPSERRVGMNT